MSTLLQNFGIGRYCGKYIRKENRDIAAALAQKTYHKKLKATIDQEVAAIEELLILLEHSPEEIYDTLSPARKELIFPLLVSDKTYQSLWLAEPYESDQYYPENLIYETRRGEKVRSKSEMMIADVYFELGIPYRYEAKLTLFDGVYRYPDFTVLDVKHRREIYHEHFGLLDKEAYRSESWKKLQQYKEAGIYLGKNLIVTYETEKSPFNIRMIKKMLKAVLI